MGEVREPLDPIGQIFVEGALWRAELAPAHDGSQNAPRTGRRWAGHRRGSRVRVESVEGLTLRVRPLEGEPDAAEAPATSDVERTKELRVGVVIAIVVLLLIFVLVVLAASDQDPARVRARRDLPARPADRPEGPGADPA